VHFPHMLAPSMAPAGKGSIQAEVYFSRKRPLDASPQEVASRAVDEFVRMGILRNREEVIFARPQVVDYANVVFDHNRAAALAEIKPFIEERCGIVLAGRYGEWDYHWTDDATNAGWKAAATITGIELEELLGE
jgi:protoporphyrinogen oxidase